MVSNRYQKAAHCRILSWARIRNKKFLPDTPETRDLRAGTAFILDDGMRLHLINPTIRLFLSSFSKPRSLQAVINAFAKKAACAPAQIEGAMTRFFNDMSAQGFLVSEAEFQQRRATKTNIQTGAVLGAYQLRQLLAEKAKLFIFLAEPVAGGKPVVLKVLKPSVWRSPDQQDLERRKFLQEFDLMQELPPHPNICRCFGVAHTDEYCYGILEFVDGLPLRNYMQQARLKMPATLQLAAQMLGALAYIHEKGILHGDIHLRNFMVEKASCAVKLIDFNLANRALPAVQEIMRKGGLHHYIPPERVDTAAFKFVQERADFRSEVWQAGIVLYHMVYGKMPFEGFSWQALANNICKTEPEYPDFTPEGAPVSEELKQFIMQSLRKNPVDRFESAGVQYAAFMKFLTRLGGA